MPGRDLLVARGGVRGGPAPPAPPAGGAPGVPAGRGSATGPALWASVELDIDGRDVGGITMSLQPGATVSGRIAFDGAPVPDIATMRPRLMLRPVLNPFPGAERGRGRCGDGTFDEGRGARSFPAGARFLESADRRSARVGDREWLMRPSTSAAASRSATWW
jgi:hypothetical protein